ncbi:MAG: SDR family NAD(P)-dependent oxidoreductase [Ktedonobacterales bacterium]
MGKLDGRVALVTGAASGLGKASANLFVAEGASVVFADLNESGAQSAAAEVAASGSVSAEQLDVTSSADCERVVAATLERYGKLDILMTCAGIGESAPILELDEATFDRTMAVNLKGTFLCAKYAFPALCRQGGSIIALGSIAGLIGAPGFAAYGASKAAVIHLMRIIALEGSVHNVRANTICPSWIWTPMVEKAMQQLAPGIPAEAAQTYLARQSPLGRMGRPEDVAKAALYLASDDAAFMTGQELVLDGGMTIGPRPV